jgi:hypothetical protein
MVEMIHHKTFDQKEIQAVKKSTTVLSNLLSHFSRYEFDKSVKTHRADIRVRTLSSFELLKVLVYAQVTDAFSVREIESSLAAHASELYHCGMKPVSRSTLCDALEKRDPAIFEDAFNALVFQAKQLSAKAGRRFRNPLNVVDASTIELCLTRCDWAKFRTAKGAVKLHVSLDGDSFFPQQVRMTTGAVHEVNEMAKLCKDQDAIHVFDRGYVDFKILHDIHLNNSVFVTRMKSNCQYDMVGIRSCSKNGPIRMDEIVCLSTEKGKRDYPSDLRRISYHDDETGHDYVFMSNSLELPAQQIADIYKARWQVEIFFKWIKQNLAIKTFWGTSKNAVFTQLWVALIVFMLLWITKATEALTASSHRIIQLLKTSLLARKTIADLFIDPDPPRPTDTNQLCLQGFRN